MGADKASHAQTQNNHEMTLSEDNEGASKEIARVESRVNSMERKLHGVIAKSDKKAIRFMGLEFQQTISESNAWLEANLRNHRSG
jgi:hypothetical protein